MNRFLLIALSATATLVAWILIQSRESSESSIPVNDAVAKLQEAWADHHTTA